MSENLLDRVPSIEFWVPGSCFRVSNFGFEHFGFEDLCVGRGELLDQPFVVRPKIVLHKKRASQFTRGQEASERV